MRYRQRPGSPPQDLTVPDYIRSGYLLVPNGPLAGEPFALADFQGGFVDEVYAGRGMAVLTTGRGNGKTGLLAAVCMAELDTLPRRKEIISAGLTQLVSDDLRREIEQMAEDVGQPLIGRKDTLQHPHTQSTIFFANGANESGLSRKPDLIVADEVAYTRPNSNRFQTLQTAAAKRPHCRFLCTSTRGLARDERNPLERLLDRQRGVLHVYSAPERDDDEQDIDVFADTWVLAANPAIEAGILAWDGIRDIQADARIDEEALQAYIAFHLNRPGGDQAPTEQMLVPPTLWRQIQRPAERLPPAEGECIAGVDLGETMSMSAVSIGWLETGRVETYGFFPGGKLSLADRGRADGVGLLYERAAKLGELFVLGSSGVLKPADLVGWVVEHFPELSLAVGDPFRSAELSQEFRQAGVRFVGRRVGFLTAGEDVRAFRGQVAGRTIAHPVSVIVLQALGRARVVYDAHRNAKLARTGARNDPAQSLLLLGGEMERRRKRRGLFQDAAEEAAAAAAPPAAAPPDPPARPTIPRSMSSPQTAPQLLRQRQQVSLR